MTIIFNIVGGELGPRTAEASALVLEGLSHVMLMLRAFELPDEDQAAQERSLAIAAIASGAASYEELLALASDSPMGLKEGTARGALTVLKGYGHTEPGSERDLVEICEREVATLLETLRSAEDIAPVTGRRVMGGVMRSIQTGLYVSILASMAHGGAESMGTV